MASPGKPEPGEQATSRERQSHSPHQHLHVENGEAIPPDKRLQPVENGTAIPRISTCTWRTALPFSESNGRSPFDHPRLLRLQRPHFARLDLAIDFFRPQRLPIHR